MFFAHIKLSDNISLIQFKPLPKRLLLCCYLSEPNRTYLNMFNYCCYVFLQSYSNEISKHLRDPALVRV